MKAFLDLEKTDIEEKPGIYVFYREQEGFKFAYIGQSTNCKNRIIQHLKGYDQHIDLSIRKHGLYSEEIPTGYKVKVIEYCEPELLDEKEVFYCKKWANDGYQLRNTTSGSQGQGKFGINPNKSSKGYRDGISYGYKKAQKEIKHLFEKHLEVSIKGKPNKNKQKALDKFNTFIDNTTGI